MYNYAYLIGKTIKIGMDKTNLPAENRLLEYQHQANIWSAVYGVENTPVTELWRREAKNNQEGYRIYSYLIIKFKTNVAFGNEWIKATPETITYFKQHAEDPGMANRFYKRVMVQYYNEPAE